jgi:hypothetical protein
MKFRIFLACLALIPGLAAQDIVPTATPAPSLQKPSGDSEIKLPTLISIPETFVPRNLRHLLMPEPIVRAIVLVGPNGNALDWVTTHATHRGLIEPAEFAIQFAYFSPGTENGIPVAMELEVEVFLKNPKMALSQIVTEGSEAPGASKFTAFDAEKFQFDISRSRDLDTPIKVEARGATVVPVDVDGKRIAGSGRFEFYVKPDGTTALSKLIEADSNEIARAALITIRELRFTPPRTQGRPTVVKVRMPFNYSAEEPEASGSTSPTP